MAHLWEQYHDPMVTQNALREYDDLKLEPGDNFLSFMNDFVRLAGETGKPRSCWKGRVQLEALQHFRAGYGAFVY